jgi:hypothetical protein
MTKSHKREAAATNSIGAGAPSFFASRHTFTYGVACNVLDGARKPADLVLSVRWRSLTCGNRFLGVAG